MKTITYSHDGPLDIQLDLYLPPSVTAGPLPALIYFHGGGIVAGSRMDIFFPTWMKDGALERGSIFISADHRLLYPTSGFHIIDDIKALFTFLASPDFSRQHLPDGVVLDANRIGVAGPSGGTYPTLLAGVHAVPKPKAIVSLFGQGGALLTDHWLSEKDAPMPLPGADAATDEFVARVMAEETVPISEASMWARPDGTVLDNRNRWSLTLGWYKNGVMLDYVLGRSGLSAALRNLPLSERLAAVPPELLPALPESQLDASFPLHVSCAR